MQRHAPLGYDRLDAMLAAGEINEVEWNDARLQLADGIFDTVDELCEIYECAGDLEQQHEVVKAHRAERAQSAARLYRRLPMQRRTWTMRTTRPREHRSTSTPTRAGPTADASPSPGDPEGPKIGPGTIESEPAGPQDASAA